MVPSQGCSSPRASGLLHMLLALSAMQWLPLLLVQVGLLRVVCPPNTLSRKSAVRTHRPHKGGHFRPTRSPPTATAPTRVGTTGQREVQGRAPPQKRPCCKCSGHVVCFKYSCRLVPHLTQPMVHLLLQPLSTAQQSRLSRPSHSGPVNYAGIRPPFLIHAGHEPGRPHQACSSATVDTVRSKAGVFMLGELS